MEKDIGRRKDSFAKTVSYSGKYNGWLHENKKDRVFTNEFCYNVSKFGQLMNVKS